MPSTALVTAAGGEIGRAVVARLLADGVVERVLAVDAAPPAGGLPAGAEAVEADLRDPAAPAALAAALPDGLAVLVNVLGGERHPALRPVPDPSWPPPEVWDDIVDLNLSTAYRVTAGLRDRLGPGSAICTVSSIAAVLPWAISPAYGAAKAALEHWSRSLAVLLADRGVRVNLVRPGFVWSPQWQAVDKAEFDRVVGDRVPLAPVAPAGRAQSGADVAAAVSFLCSPAARHTTGQAIDVDGGATLVRAPR
jgi:NAD(P)-dependent dehydrogenase (short-subunit alcohol dehydrogenase family)